MAASLTVDEKLVKAVWEYSILCDKSLKDLRSRSCSEIEIRKEIVFTGRKVPYRMSSALPRVVVYGVKILHEIYSFFCVVYFLVVFFNYR